jgi:hypothetical protein
VPNHYKAGSENRFHHQPMAWASSENDSAYNKLPLLLLPEFSISSHHFAAISHHVVQDFGSLLKY